MRAVLREPAGFSFTGATMSRWFLVLSLVLLAAPGEEVTVSFLDQKKTTKADDKGNWQIKLDD